ncbi:MAG: hypothetical protein O2955_12590 [Planctomycetota bacterium]|nr:hypothetical protein [Planctomycetota bacterium]
MYRFSRLASKNRSAIFGRLKSQRLAWYCGASFLLLVPVAFIASGMVQVTHALEDDAAATTETASSSAPGLSGILPSETPGDLSFEAFAVLDGNWTTWSEETSELVTRLYEETPDLAGQHALIHQLENRLAVMAKSIADPRYRSIHDKLIDLHGKLNRRLIIATAILNTLETNPTASRDVMIDSARQTVLSNLDALHQYLGTRQNGEGWLTYVHAENLNELRQQPVQNPAGLERLTFVVQRLGSSDQLPEPTQQEFLSQPIFADLGNSLSYYLAVAQSAPSSDSNEQLRAQLAELMAALEAYEASGSRQSAETVRNVFDQIKASSPDGGAELTAALRETYFNYNLKIVASEKFLQHVIAEEREEHGDVIDCILGAYVTGEQTTVSDVGIDLLPESNGIRFDITVNGTVNSNTSGDKKQATIYTEGTHYFEARKEILFRDEEFYSTPARIGVDANNYNFDADTMLSGLPILRGIGRTIALSEANRLRPQAEAIAASRVEDRVLPQFDEEVDGQFAKATDDMQRDVFQKLRDNNLEASAARYVSTESHLWANQRLMSHGELGGGIAPRHFDTESGLVVQVHESNMNNALDRLDFAGKTMTDDEVRTELETQFRELLGREVSLPKPEIVEGEEAGPNTFVFAATDPIRMKVSAGSLVLVLRSGFKQEGKDDIPTQEITIPLNFEVNDESILVTRGIVAVAPVEQPESVAQQIAQAGVIRKKFDSQLPDRTVRVKRKNNRPDFVAHVRKIKPLNGWLTIVVE